MKPPGSWKNFESRVARVFGLKRRGADYGDRSGGKTDAVNVDGTESTVWALEMKFGKQLGYQALLNACRQVEAAAKPLQEPVVVAKQVGQRFNDSLVVMRLETFQAWRLNSDLTLDDSENDED